MALGEGLRISVQLSRGIESAIYLHKEPFLITICELSSDASSPVPR